RHYEPAHAIALFRFMFERSTDAHRRIARRKPAANAGVGARIAWMTPISGELCPTGFSSRPGRRSLPGGTGKMRQRRERFYLLVSLVVRACSVTPLRLTDWRRDGRWIALCPFDEAEGCGYFVSTRGALVNRAMKVLH